MGDELTEKLKAVRMAVDGALGEIAAGDKAKAKENWVNIQETMDSISSIFEAIQ